MFILKFSLKTSRFDQAMMQFEHLPNELILDIFKYLYPDDLFISLFNLNTRLNTLIYTQPLSISLNNWIPKYKVDLYYKSILFPARDQIHTLELNDAYERLSNFLANDSQIQVDFETRIFILSQVKTLILYDPKKISLKEILKYIINVEDLRISMLRRSRDTPDYIQGLFKHLFQIKSLQRLNLQFYDTLVIDYDIGILIF
jgi:hypothetical protein